MSGPASHLWFSPNLAGVFDIDALIYDPDVGFFVIEVKAVSLGMIEEYSAGGCRIKGRLGSLSPLSQAKRATDSLAAYARDVGRLAAPFFRATAAFPEFTRSEFLAEWGSVPVDAQARGMIFADDLVSSGALLARLREAADHPPIGGVPKRKPQLPYPQIDDLITAFSQRSAVRKAPSDLEHIRRIASASAKPRADKMRSYVLKKAGRTVRFTGPPGTGKTDRLLQVGLAHAQLGHRVLFTCFNKVLRSEISRLLAASTEHREAIGLIDVIHVDALWVELDRKRWPATAYGTILLDEAQDMPDDKFAMLKTLATTDSEWFIADGAGQELYDHDCRWLTTFRGEAEEKRETFRYRNAGPLGLLAGAVRELAPETDEIQGWLESRGSEYLKPSEDDEQLALDSMELPDLPTIVRMDSGSTIDSRRQFVKALISDELGRLQLEGRPGDLAILAAKRPVQGYGGDAAAACEALEELGVPFIDQINSDNRLEVVPPGTVRVVTMHSSRGIEVSRTLILGLERLGGKGFGDPNKQRALAYVALSRAKRGLTIVSIPRAGSSVDLYIDFAEGVVATIAKMTRGTP